MTAAARKSWRLLYFEIDYLVMDDANSILHNVASQRRFFRFFNDSCALSIYKKQRIAK